MLDYSLESYDYKLDSNLIATSPIFPKSKAKLLVYIRDENKILHTNFSDFFNYIPKDSLIVLNDTRVIKARIYGYKVNNKERGGKIELLFHKAISNHTFLVQINGKVKIGDTLIFNNILYSKVLDLLDDGLRIVSFSMQDKLLNKKSLLNILDDIGYIPIPPYIKRESSINDAKDYQSVFAKNIGSIAAPTASLHFSKEDLKQLKYFNHCFITLHIGAGTFFNIKTNDIREHKMHKESFIINKQAKEKIDSASKILCIGTTATRCVEYYARTNITNGECDLFINPFNKPIKVDYLLTNFHLPKSSLMMLVAGFIGLDKTKELYKTAIDLEYRFYSYGDGMLIL